MRCEKVQACLPAYIDNAAGWLTRRRIAAHLRECAACAREKSAHERMLLLLKAAPVERAPRDITAAVMARLPERPAPMPRLRAARPLMLAPAAVALALAVQVWTRDPGPPVAVPRAPHATYIREYARFRATQEIGGGAGMLVLADELAQEAR